MGSFLEGSSFRNQRNGDHPVPSPSPWKTQREKAMDFQNFLKCRFVMLSEDVRAIQLVDLK